MYRAHGWRRRRHEVNGAARILIGLNAGLYETIDLSQWIAGNPADVLATNFAQPAELFGKFPKHDVFLAGKDGPEK